MTPFAYQESDITHLVSLFKSGRQACVNGSDPGTGKTLVGIETVKRLGDPATLVVCPKAVIPAWQRTAAAQGVDISVTNYEMVRTGQGRLDYKTKLRDPAFGIWNDKGKFCWSRGIQFLIIDEAHRCKGLESQTSELMRAAKRQGIITLPMSATIADSPVEMDALGFLLGLHDGFNARPSLRKPNPVTFYKWAEKFGCYGNLMQNLPYGFYGSEATKRHHMASLNAELFPKRGVRTRIEDLPGFPEQQVTAELYDIDDPARMDAVYREMAEALARLKEICADDAEHPLTQILRARQEAELLKVPVFVSIAKDAVDQGMTVLIFVNFRATLLELCKRLNTDCFIDGTQVGDAGAKRREENRLRIQNDEARILVGINEAAGVGIDLHDITGKHPRLGLASAPQSAKTVKQLLGRPRRANAKSKSLFRFVFANCEAEQRQHAKLASKLDCLDALNDGDLDAGNLELSARI